MTDEKQIKEMAKVIYKRINTIETFGLSGMELCGMIAKELIKHYQPKLPENAVVLTKEEYQNDYSSQFNKGYSHGSKETAREIIEMLIPDCEVCVEAWHKGCMCLRAKLAGKIAKNKVAQ